MADGLELGAGSKGQRARSEEQGRISSVVGHPSSDVTNQRNERYDVMNATNAYERLRKMNVRVPKDHIFRDSHVHLSLNFSCAFVAFIAL